NSCPVVTSARRIQASRIVSKDSVSGRYDVYSPQLHQSRNMARPTTASDDQKNAAVHSQAIFGSSQLKKRSGLKKFLRKNRIFFASRIGVGGLDSAATGA